VKIAEGKINFFHHGNQRRNDNYHRMGVTCKPLPLADIPRHISPASVYVNEKEIVTRPAEWI
jgi:hypothetical protein